MGSAATDAESDDEIGIGISKRNSIRFLKALTEISRSTKKFKDFHCLVSSFQTVQDKKLSKKTNNASESSTEKRHSDEERRNGNVNAGIKRARMTDVDEHVSNAKSTKGKSRAPIESFKCENCKRSFSTKAALKTHKVGDCHAGLPESQETRRRRKSDDVSNPTSGIHKSTYAKENAKWLCSQCNKTYSAKSSLKRHVDKVHSGKKPKCVSDDKDFAANYKRCGNINTVRNVEQFIIVNGNYNTKSDKTPNFLREAEKINRYTSLICALCKVEYDDPVELNNHYQSYHKITPSTFESLQHLLYKGTYLDDLSASKTLSRDLAQNTDSYVSAPKHTKQKSEQKEKKKDTTIKTKVQDDSRIIEDSTAGPSRIKILDVKELCKICNKFYITNNFKDVEAHAATHKNYQYVAVEVEDIQRNDGNAVQKQMCDVKSGDVLSQSESIEIEGSGGGTGGTVEPLNSENDSRHGLRISSHVVQEDVYVERKESEVINQTIQDKSGYGNRSEENGNKDITDYATIDKTSEINADSNHQVQETEEQEERELWQDLYNDLENLTGPGEIHPYVDKSTSDKITKTQELLEILETDTTVQGTSEINNYREEHAVIQNKNNDSTIYSRNSADESISQDIFTSDGDTSEIYNNNINDACTTLTQTDYRHNQIAKIIHQNLAHKHDLIQNTHTPYYEYTPLPVLENTTHKLYYDHAILTDRNIDYNRPDIMLIDKVNKTTYLIDISVPNTHNIQETITAKTTKYEELKDEVARIWRQEKVYVVPIVLSTTGFNPKHLHHGLKLLGLTPHIYTILQKAAILNK